MIRLYLERGEQETRIEKNAPCPVLQVVHQDQARRTTDVW